MRPTLTSVFILAGACLALAPASALAATTLKSPDWKTRYPSDWGRTKEKRSADVKYTLTRPGTTVRQLGLPEAPGGAAITVASYRASSLRKTFKRAIPTRSSRLLKLMVGVPRDAQGVHKTQKQHAVRLGGVRASAVTYAYTFAGRQNVQYDIVARRGHTCLLLELNMDPAIGDAGLAPWRSLRSSWRWRG
jgi:hypothetical protein